MLLGFIVGLVAEWLRRGLQILAPRFDSGRGLHRFTRFFEIPKVFGVKQPLFLHPEKGWEGFGIA